MKVKARQNGATIKSVKSNLSGLYTIDGLDKNSTYTIKPKKKGSKFIPKKKDVDVQDEDVADVDFLRKKNASAPAAKPEVSGKNLN